MTRCGASSSNNNNNNNNNNNGQRPLNTVQVEHPSHTAVLLSGLNALRSKGLLLDVTLVAGNEAFRGSRF